MKHMIGTFEDFKGFTDPRFIEEYKDDKDICSMWKRCAESYADNIALETADTKFTYRQLDMKVSRMRSALAKAGCGTGGKIGVLCRNSIDCVYAFLAVVTSGNTAVMFPPHMESENIRESCESFGISALIYQQSFTRTTAELKKLLPELILVNSQAQGETVSRIVTPSPENICFILFTGGTTGRQKGALLSHRAVFKGTVNGIMGIRNFDNQRFLLLLPLSHVFGLIRCLLACFYIGGDIFISTCEKDMIRDIRTFKPTITAFVPMLAELALDLHKKIGGVFTDDLKTAFIGAAHVSHFLIEEYSKLGAEIFPGYGLTEASCLVLGNPHPFEKCESVGKVYPGQEIKIVDGELWIKGENLLSGYIGTDEHATDDEGWFRTGDLARIDDDGYVYITGRLKDVIVLKNGENIYPAQLESRFNDLPYVRDSQVYVDNEEKLVLDVILRESDKSEEDILDELWKINSLQRSAEQVQKINIRMTDFERTANKKIVRNKHGQN